MSSIPTSQAQHMHLERVFGVDTILKTWKQTVRLGMRKQAALDLHDYLDVHRNGHAFAERLRELVISGNYRPRQPFEVRLEKQLGITRRLLIPSPQDAVVLQVIVDALSGPLKAARPTNKSYYSRTHAPPRDEEIDDTFDYPWWRLWPQYQQRILQFASVHNYVVNTDVANYFDSVSLGRLRESLSSLSHFPADLLDFLFYVLEAFLWRHKYAPAAPVGLPQLNFDAPRLLAHAFLYPVDELLDRRAKGDFVRWMDDINFGVTDRSEAKAVLGELQLVLNALGLRVNAGKSKVLSGAEARDYFFAQRNRQLTILRNARLNGVVGRASLRQSQLQAWFRDFMGPKRDGNWEKVLKRFVNEFAEYEDTLPQRYFGSWLADRPAMRDTVFRYLGKLGYSPRRYKLVAGYLLGGDCVDDVSALAAAKLLVEWRIPARSPAVQRTVQVGNELAPRGTHSASRFLAALWLLSKYAAPPPFTEFVIKHSALWRASEFAARQVAAATPFLTAAGEKRVRRSLAESGLRSALEVLASIDEMRSAAVLGGWEQSYLVSSRQSGAYPLQKLLVVGALVGPESRLLDKDKLLSDLSGMVQDSVSMIRLHAIRSRRLS